MGDLASMLGPWLNSGSCAPTPSWTGIPCCHTLHIQSGVGSDPPPAQLLDCLWGLTCSPFAQLHLELQSIMHGLAAGSVNVCVD